MEKKVRNIKIITILTIVIIFLSIIVLSCQLIKIGNLRSKTTELETHKQQLIEQINNYQSSNSYYNNNRSEYLEDYAREVLGWGELDETWYTKG